jgi:hypothetical protein
MVHSTHLQIFDEYYPTEFDNWWLDDWISAVYGPERTRRLHQWTVKHHTNKHGQRYQAATSQSSLLAPLVQNGRRKVDEFIGGRKCSNSSALHSERVHVKGGSLLEFFSKREWVSIDVRSEEA